ncbi:hypothetical protein [Caenimonas aquaedulcis]|uniref:D-alanine--D-alanine ligase n=1 Tax=Caenimonas aquaedulcis TaxID=2793270 RepID=A0A931MH12_9BURK|nr:hypothetical protein [Caenimonas aquaedulcis]MBG9388666.1 hypothetical protein [Caenimonas aquaedulcis]
MQAAAGERMENPGDAWPGADATARRSTLERMPKWLICVPLVLQWLWLGLRYRSLTLPSAANPSITAGGLVGEGKLEYFRGMGGVARAATARHIGMRNDGTANEASLRARLAEAGLAFPLIAKPDLGLCGHGVRRVDDMPSLLDYLARFPAGEVVVLQEYLPQDGEAGIFYARDPRTDEGRIIGLALRTFPQVVGDGVRTVAELVAADPRASRIGGSPRHECAVDASRVPAAGEAVRLATIGSTRVGGLYRDGAACITPQLVAAVDAIARDMPHFHFGRFDVRFDSLASLRAGNGLRIMEVNGAGSEAIEAWDPATGLVEGFRAIFRKQALLFAIGDARRREGTRPISVLELARLNQRQYRLIEHYPPSN